MYDVLYRTVLLRTYIQKYIPTCKLNLSAAPGLLDRHLAAGGTDCSSTDRDTTRRDIYALLQGWDCTLRNQSHSSVVWNSSCSSTIGGKGCPREEGRERVGGRFFFSLLRFSLTLPLYYSLRFLFLVPPPPYFAFFSWGRFFLFRYGDFPDGEQGVS